MTGTDVVRDCTQCGRQVHDLSAMFANEADDLLAQSDGHRLCITYSRGPDVELITRDRPARFAFAAAAALTLSLAGSAPANAQKPSEASSQSALAKAPKGGLRGTIRLLARDALADVEVEARDVKTGRQFKVVSHQDGSYELRLPKGRYDVSMHMRGLDRCVVEGVDVRDRVLVADANLTLPLVGEFVGPRDTCGNVKLDSLRHKK